MRKLLLAAAAGLLVTPVVAAAQDSGYGTDIPGHEKDQGMSNPEPGTDVRTAQPMAGMPAQAEQLFQGNVKTWDVKGTVSSVDMANHEITIKRDKEKLPDAQLSLVDSTKITMNGKQATLQDIQQGAEVRAEFQLAEDKPVAVKLDAKPMKEHKDMGTQGGTMGGSEKDMKH
jgi:hypothetical protein